MQHFAHYIIGFAAALFVVRWLGHEPQWWVAWVCIGMAAITLGLDAIKAYLRKP